VELCPSCHRIVSAEAPSCRVCGEPLGGSARVLELTLDDDRRLPLAETVTIGRAEGNDLRLDDQSVSRRHARVVIEWDGDQSVALLEDLGSSYGTRLDGEQVDSPRQLHSGSTIDVGDTQLRVGEREGAMPASAPAKTLHIGAASSALLARIEPGRANDDVRPRARSGLAMKRLTEGARRYAVIRGVGEGSYVRITTEDADLFELVDGTRTLEELLAAAEERFGSDGPSRLARLLADLGDRGMLEGVERSEEEEPGLLKRLVQPRERLVEDPDLVFEELYEDGAWRLFSRPALIALAVLAIGGIAAFAVLVVNRYGTPFVVADRVGLGAIVFLLGRVGLVGAHEVAHGVAMAAVGRPVHRAGVKLIMILPFGFVDTSEAWFEPRRRRLVVAAAGPASDVSLAATFALISLALPAGAFRDIAFQLSLAGFVAAFFNLNPFLDRDGYQILADVLDEPGLRRRSREALVARLSGRPTPPDARGVLMPYALAGLGWAVASIGLVVAMTLQYYDQLIVLVPEGLVLGFAIAIYALLAVPVVLTLVGPLVTRRRAARGEVGRVVP
jgi:putative peptide zinc metalloprotease protein